jgi:hypothetical protein
MCKLSTALRALSMGMLGGIAFALLGVMNNVHAPLQDKGVEIAAVYGMLFVLGAIVTLGLATGLDIVEQPQTKGAGGRRAKGRREDGGSPVSG